MKSRFVIFGALSALTLVACGRSDDPEAANSPSSQSVIDDYSDPVLIADGRAIVQDQCLQCHTDEADGESPWADAPSLRTVLASYDTEALETDFREGIHVGHPDMPDFNFDPLGAHALLAYLISIQDQPIHSPNGEAP